MYIIQAMLFSQTHSVMLSKLIAQGKEVNNLNDTSFLSRTLRTQFWVWIILSVPQGHRIKKNIVYFHADKYQHIKDCIKCFCNNSIICLTWLACQCALAVMDDSKAPKWHSNNFKHNCEIITDLPQSSPLW